MMFHKDAQIEFVGGPLDGHVHTIAQPEDEFTEVIGVTIDTHGAACLDKRSRRSKANPPSVAVYRLQSNNGKERYRFIKSAAFRDFADEYGLTE